MAWPLQPSGPAVRSAMTLVTSLPLPTSHPPPLSSPIHSGLEGFPPLALGGSASAGDPYSECTSTLVLT